MNKRRQARASNMDRVGLSLFVLRSLVALIALAACVGWISLWTGAVEAQPLENEDHRDFSIPTRDGYIVRGSTKLRSDRTGAIVIMVAGTGLSDRDLRSAQGEDPRNFIFRDLAGRLEEANISTVRFDRRGVQYSGFGRPARIVPAEAATMTVETQRDDLLAVYDWTRSKGGLGARCVIFLGHSEGVRNIADLAEAGAPSPHLVVGIGAPMRSPVDLMRWQMAERGSYILRMMDSNQDGAVTRSEIAEGWRRTPASGLPFFRPEKMPNSMTEISVDVLAQVQAQFYQREKARALELDAAAPFPSAAAPIASTRWWKSWFTDERPIAPRLSAWSAKVILHYGLIDSQVAPDLEAAAARNALGDRLTVRLHPARGHALGENALLGPMDEAIAKQMVDEIAAAARSC